MITTNFACNKKTLDVEVTNFLNISVKLSLPGTYSISCIILKKFFFK